jgi:hypothetical protein
MVTADISVVHVGQQVAARPGIFGLGRPACSDRQVLAMASSAKSAPVKPTFSVGWFPR